MTKAPAGNRGLAFPRGRGMVQLFRMPGNDSAQRAALQAPARKQGQT
jgi:hypothetical protein